MNIKKISKAVGGACALLLGVSHMAEAQTILPSDPQTSGCSVDQSTFNSWFGGTAPSVGSKAVFADSVGFPTDNTKCDFYKWSAQMFLWLSSPEGQSYVFDSVSFFDVSPEDAQGKRVLIPNEPGTQGGTYTLRSVKGDEVIGETGQAGGGGVLISQNGSIIYYGIHVNNMYAYFLSGMKNLGFPAHDFPNTKLARDWVYAYALSQGVDIKDADALTMELKTSWIDASHVDTSKYLTITSTVPNYTQADDKLWKLDGAITKRLALVGMHIVGTVQDHPEMVWATVEHLDNAPDTAYYYINNKGTTVLEPMPSSGSWTFASTSTADIQWNVERQAIYSSPSKNFPICMSKTCSPGDIVAYMDNTIGASLTVRVNPWGNAGAFASHSSVQNPENTSELISLNNDVLGFLPDGDVRKHYFLSGAVWTQHGNIPTYDGKGPAFNQIGSISLANSTMESYHQETATSPTTADAGCFMCHSISGEQAIDKKGVEVSHIFDDIKPIPMSIKVSEGKIKRPNF